MLKQVDKPFYTITYFPAADEDNPNTCTLKYILMRIVHQLNAFEILPTTTEIKTLVYLVVNKGCLQYLKNLKLSFKMVTYREGARVINIECDEVLKLLVIRKVIIKRKGRCWVSPYVDLDKISVPDLDWCVYYYSSIFRNFILRNFSSYVITTNPVSDLLSCFYGFCDTNSYYQQLIAMFVDLIKGGTIDLKLRNVNPKATVCEDS